MAGVRGLTEPRAWAVVAAVGVSLWAAGDGAAQPPATCSLGHLGITPLPAPTLDRAAEQPSRDNLQAWVLVQTDPSLRGRAMASPGAARLAGLLAEQMGAFGLGPLLAGNELCQIIPIDFSPPDHNVMAVMSPDLSDTSRPVVVVMAHYDGLGTDPYSGRVFEGANDNASGVAVLMEVARSL